MFAPQPDRVAAELARVCRTGGRLHMANWTGEGFAGNLFRCVGRYVPPPAGVPSPVLWGNEETVRERLSPYFTNIELTRRHYPRWAHAIPVPEVVEHYRRYFGPVKRAFEAQSDEGQRALRRDLEDVFSRFNRATDGGTVLEGEYLNVSAIRR